MKAKFCSACKIEKPLEHFGREKRGYRDGHRNQCIKCRSAIKREREKASGYKYVRKPRKVDRKMRDSHYRRKYNITHDDFDRMLAEQNDQCALCRKPSHRALNGRLCVDHCHETGVIRGLLCTECNISLARWGDNIAGVERVLRYVAKGA